METKEQIWQRIEEKRALYSEVQKHHLRKHKREINSYEYRIYSTIFSDRDMGYLRQFVNQLKH